jgi:hypothetical protein
MLSIAAARGADKDKPFRPEPAASYPGKQTIGGVTIAAVPYETEDEMRTAFEKLNLYKHGILPILVVVQNDSKQAVRMENLQVEYLGPNRGRVEQTPAAEVRFASGPGKPRVTPKPIGGVAIGRGKNPLEHWTVEGRAFTAKMFPPGESAHGFFYFEAGFQKGARLYLNGLTEAATGKELFYFEIPLE